MAADYLEELLDIADLDGDIDTYVDGDRAHVSVISDSTVLVGKDGEVLDALQELTRLAVLAETGQRSRLMLDVAGYRAKRRTELIALAESQSEFNYNPTLQKLVEEIVIADQRVNNYRAEYDAIVVAYNEFLEENHQEIKEIDASSTMEKRPLFQMVAGE